MGGKLSGEDLCDSLGIQERPLQIVCYRYVNKMGLEGIEEYVSICNEPTCFLVRNFICVLLNRISEFCAQFYL